MTPSNGLLLANFPRGLLAMIVRCLHCQYLTSVTLLDQACLYGAMMVIFSGWTLSRKLDNRSPGNISLHAALGLQKYMAHSLVSSHPAIRSMQAKADKYSAVKWMTTQQFQYKLAS